MTDGRPRWALPRWRPRCGWPARVTRRSPGPARPPAVAARPRTIPTGRCRSAPPVADVTTRALSEGDDEAGTPSGQDAAVQGGTGSVQVGGPRVRSLVRVASAGDSRTAPTATESVVFAPPAATGRRRRRQHRARGPRPWLEPRPGRRRLPGERRRQRPRRDDRAGIAGPGGLRGDHRRGRPPAPHRPGADVAAGPGAGAHGEWRGAAPFAAGTWCGRVTADRSPAARTAPAAGPPRRGRVSRSAAPPARCGSPRAPRRSGSGADRSARARSTGGREGRACRCRR